MLTRQTIISIALLFTLTAGTAHAEWIPPAWNYNPYDIHNTIDRPAQESNQIGWANDPRWQMLGDSWGVNNGVSWTVLDANGNYGTFGHEDVRVGDQVVFKFDMYKTLYGTHTFDALRAWIDWDNDGFSADIVNDLIIEDSHVFNPYGWYSDDPTAQWWGQSLYYAGYAVSFFSDAVTFSKNGDYDLLARVLCSRDLGGGSAPGVPANWDELTPWANGTEHQGEMERYTVHVVPLPAALLLFGSGLFSMGFFRRKSRATV